MLSEIKILMNVFSHSGGDHQQAILIDGCPLPDAIRQGRSTATKSARIWTLHRIHKWTGLLAALWLAVLGTTGFAIDHRDWRWLWQPAFPAAWLPHAVAAKSVHGAVGLYQINPQKPTDRLAGGRRGLWLSVDNGRHWSRPGFEKRAGQPQILAIEPDPVRGWQRLWLATDDGVWRSADGGHSFARIALSGQLVTALTAGDRGGALLGVVERSRVFRLDTAQPRLVEWLDLQPLDPHLLPAWVDLSRLVHDVHFGRGIFSGGASLLLNDIAAFALVLLPLTGFLYWALPKHWKRRRRAGQEVSARTKGRTIRWLFRLHGPLAGIVTLVPIVYLCLTGILLDHGTALNRWMHSISLTRAWLPPVYKMGNWQDQIYAIAGYPGAANTLSIGTRAGLFTSTDSGHTWARDEAASGFIWTMRRVGGALFIGGMGSPNFVKTDGGAWRVVRSAGMMPSDVTALPGGGWAWKSVHGFKITDRPSSDVSTALPEVTQATWFDVFDGLHSGLLIHVQWKWMNDLFAVAAILLVLTGIPRWWRKKWM